MTLEKLQNFLVMTNSRVRDAYIQKTQGADILLEASLAVHPFTQNFTVSFFERSAFSHVKLGDSNGQSRNMVATYRGAAASALFRLPPMNVVNTTWPAGALSGNIDDENSVPAQDTQVLVPVPPCPGLPMLLLMRSEIDSWLNIIFQMIVLVRPYSLFHKAAKMTMIKLCYPTIAFSSWSSSNVSSQWHKSRSLNQYTQALGPET